MKKLVLIAIVVNLVGCNAMTTTADHISKQQSSFSQNPTTIYPTADGKKDGEKADFVKQAF